MTTSYWRKQAAPLIAQVIKDVGTSDLPALRRALSDAFPWEPKSGHRYKIWLSEIKRQLAPMVYQPPPWSKRRSPEPAPGQLNILETKP